MGSWFGKKNKPAQSRSKRDGARLAPQMPPPKPTEDIDPNQVMLSPEVNLVEKFPPGVIDGLEQHIQEGCRGLLVDPEDEETRVFAFYEDRIAEIGRCPVKDHDALLQKLNYVRGGAISANGVRYRIETFNSLSDFGDRMVLNFLQEGALSDEEILQRRRENIRLVNKLKPATSLTRKNILDMHATVVRNPKPTSFAQILQEDGLVEAAQVEAVAGAEDPLLSLLQAVILPRKAAAAALARYLGFTYVDAEGVSLDKPLARRVEKQWALTRQCIPYSQDGNVARVAMMDPTDTALIEELKAKLGMEIEPFCSAAQDIMVVIHKAHKVD